MPHIPMPSAAWRFMLSLSRVARVAGGAPHNDCVPEADKLLEVQGETRPTTTPTSVSPSPTQKPHPEHELTATNVLQPSLIRPGKQWTKRYPQIIEDPLYKRKSRTYQDSLERTQA